MWTSNGVGAAVCVVGRNDKPAVPTVYADEGCFGKSEDHLSYAMDQLEQRVNEFFMNAKKNKPEWREEQMTSIKKDYYKALEDADEKVQLANQIYDL
ncbi:PREDICTED: inhibitor of growth protein 3-like, partial [Pterocles gutturalis]|uniref:inhibitor of growth protein 3-like n=1 Tax=Pterocles gutturalis TaxID=240206 RepID=UPI0005289F02